MFVSVTTIPVRDESQLAKMEESFKKNVPDLKKIDGFVSFELWKQDGEVKSVARWESKDAFESYIHSEMFHQHHANQGKGGGEGHRPKIEYFDALSF